MVPDKERHHSLGTGNDDFEGRDLLVGPPAGVKVGAVAGAAAPPSDAQDQAIAKIDAAVRAKATRIDTLQ